MRNLVSGCWLLNLKVRHLGTLITSVFWICRFDYFLGVKNLRNGCTFFGVDNSPLKLKRVRLGVISVGLRQTHLESQMLENSYEVLGR